MSSDLKSFGSLSSAFALRSDCQSGQVPMQEHWVITECTWCFLNLLNLTSTLSNVLRLRDRVHWEVHNKPPPLPH